MAPSSTPDLRPSYLEHRAIRVDAGRLTDLVAASQPADASRLAALSAWHDRYETAIHHHHRAEEAVIYPALLARDPSFAEADGELEGEHRVLIDRLAVVRGSLAALPAATGGSRWEREREEAVIAARALLAIVQSHLDPSPSPATRRPSPPPSSTTSAGRRGSWWARRRSSSPARGCSTAPPRPSGTTCSPPSRC
jgi:Hemerythrin HHE cation binding domain